MSDKNAKFSITVEAIDKTTATLRAINMAVARTVRPARAASLALSGHTINFGMKRVGVAASEVGQRFNNLASSARSVGRAGLYAVGALGGVFYMLKKSADSGDEAVKAAQRFGTTVPEWQKLAYAAKLADVSNEDLGTSLKKVGNNAVAAATGNQEAATWFRRAGITVRDQNGHMKTSTQLVSELADKFQQMPDGLKKTALATGLMGKSGEKLIPLLNGGAKGLREAGDEAERKGLADDEAAHSGDRFNDSLKRLMGSVEGTRNAIAGPFMDAITEIIKPFEKWLDLNRAPMKAEAKKWAAGLSQALPGLGSGLLFVGRILLWVLKLVNSAVQMFGGWGTVVAALSGLIAGKLIWSVLMLTRSIATLGLVTAVTPLGLFMIAIAAVAGAAYLLYENWEAVKQSFSDLADFFSVTKALEKINNLLPKSFTENGTKMSQALTGQIGPAVPSAIGPGGGSRSQTQIGGVLKIDIDSQGRPRVTKAESSGGLDLDVETGYMLLN